MKYRLSWDFISTWLTLTQLSRIFNPLPPKKTQDFTVQPQQAGADEQGIRFPRMSRPERINENQFYYLQQSYSAEGMRVNICPQSFPSFLTSGPLPSKKKKQKNSRLFFYYKRSAIRQLCFYLQVLENCTGMRVSRSATRVLKLLHWTENKITNYNHCNYEKFTPVQKERKNNLIFLLLVPLFTLLLSVHLSSLESACYNYQRPIRKQLHRKLSFRFLLLELPFKIKAVQNSNGIKHL